jgi:predicted O-linked N-acetylglucosamine transferase (SPINDLY family)
MTDRLRSLAHHWRDISVLGDNSVETLVREDQIDLLVDLSGHTARHRLRLFSRRLAPVQATWLGYSGTTGLQQIDFLIGDSQVCPLGLESLYSESVYRLDGAYLCFRPPRHAPEIASLPALERGLITFGSFNKLFKLSPQLAALWSEVLQAVPNSRLLLKTPALDDPGTAGRFRALFGNYGIGSDRIELLGGTTHREVLESYGRVDIALDPAPYNGTMTTLEGLWMGVPFITLAGDGFASRVGASIATVIGLDADLVATTEAEYVTRAVTLASDVKRLAVVRVGMRARVLQSTLGDVPAFTRRLEAAYRDMWSRWCLASTPGAP